MSSGIFGSIRPARITPSSDAEMYYTYRPTRSAEDAEFNGKYKTLDPGECLVNSVTEDNKVIDGVYELRLPLSVFYKKGFYTIYIKPKETTLKITDVSVLAAYPDVKGIVFNNPGVEDLTGYRIEFGDGTTRIIKSCNRCQPVAVSTGDGYPRLRGTTLLTTLRAFSSAQCPLRPHLRSNLTDTHISVSQERK